MRRVKGLFVLCIDVLKGNHLGILGVYLPDSNHGDEEVEALHCQMDEQLERLRREKRSCLIAGDLNAQIGGLDELDDARILGPFGHGMRSSRGKELLRWSTMQSLIVANTHFDHGETGA